MGKMSSKELKEAEKEFDKMVDRRIKEYEDTIKDEEIDLVYRNNIKQIKSILELNSSSAMRAYEFSRDMINSSILIAFQFILVFVNIILRFMSTKYSILLNVSKYISVSILTILFIIIFQSLVSYGLINKINKSKRQISYQLALLYIIVGTIGRTNYIDILNKHSNKK